MRSFCFILSLLVPLSNSFFLTGPETALSSEPIQITWTREAGDPVSFGLMQRSLAGDSPIVGITGVPNEAGATTGTVSVVFQTAGQFILSGVDQLTYDPDITPKPLAAGKQIAVAESGLPPDTAAPPPPVGETSTTAQSMPESTPTLPPNTPTTTPITTTTPLKTVSSNQVVNQPPASFSSTIFGAGLANTKPQQPTASSTTASAAPKMSLSEDQSTAVHPQSKLSSQDSTQMPASPQSSSKSLPTPAIQHASSNSGRGSKKPVIIAAVVTVCIVLFFAGLVIFLRRQRASTARRLHGFRQRMNTIFFTETDNRTHLSIPSWGPTHVIDIRASNGLGTTPSNGIQPGVESAVAPVVSEKGVLTDVPAAPAITSGAANNCSSPVRTSPVPLTPPPSYDGHGAVTSSRTG